MAETKAPAVTPSDDGKNFLVSAPAVSLPKGGGAIRGMGEKFAANPMTGTGSMSVPIATSPGRGGFGPQLALAYDSGAGNGPFGFGWSLSLPAITRKTDKGLPRYDDATESDVFLLSGAEDLVPVFRQDASGNWVLDAQGKMVIHEDDRTIDGVSFKVRRYRPRIEGLFARIERWTNVATGEMHWRSISRDNITTLYGKDNNSRIFDPTDPDPAHPTRIFSWLICESYDDKGNAVVYEYAAENDLDIDRGQANERNRVRTANRYLKRIKYGNRVSRLVQPDFTQAAWMFEAVFDYGEHDQDSPAPRDARLWDVRQDPFSSYRAGFEVRTYRLCQRVLMFHHFPGEAGVGADCLVRSTDFTYSYERDPDNASNPIYSFLRSVMQSGYKRANNSYMKRSLPPVEFEYTQPIVQDMVEEVDSASLENLPVGLDGGAYQWTDPFADGTPGVLVELNDVWFYKRNLSPMNVIVDNGARRTTAKFAPIELVATKPNLSLAGGAQFLALVGGVQLDLVKFDYPKPGFYASDGAEGWRPFRPFRARLNRNMHDPNLKFIDLDDDGHADILITEDDAFVWHASLAEEGFGPAQRVAQALDEEKGPRIVFADGTQSIYLADLSGDGLTDLARIRNGEVCYWPNLGYGRFGAKVTMDHAPWFDNPDQFEQKRIRLADIDGSGTTDIIYLHRDGVRLYFNQSGNGWSMPRALPVFSRVDDIVTITAVDLLGNGTACLVWSSPLPGDARRPMRYVNLMGGQKPHLLIKTRNNLGAETEVEYAPSTKFYLQDKYAGQPWITRLPFPVHVVEKVTVRDRWRKVEFSSTYSYHHGYFDGTEREFRGFGRVEQIDVEDFGRFAAGNVASPYITGNQDLYQPPVKTVTWYHTGAFLDREHILTQFEHEYFPHWFEAQDPSRTNVLGDFRENSLPQPDLAAQDLSADEWRQALRACKGMPLRQEIYQLDVDALVQGQHKTVKLFSTAYHNCHIRRLQPQAANRHAVFLVTESEAITYHYELDLLEDTLRPDPRITHTLNLATDEYGNVLQSVAAVYPRIDQFDDGSLQSGDLDLIRSVQRELHLAYTENRFTQDVEDADTHRLRQPCEVLTYELTGIATEDADDRVTPDPRDNRYFTLDELRRYRLSTVHQTGGTAVAEIPYHTVPDRATPQKRLVEHVRVLFFDENLSDPLPLGQLGRLGLPYETYKLALTEGLLAAVFGSKLTADVRRRLDNPDISGYLSISALAARFHGDSATGQYWLRSGIAGFAVDAAQHFFLPERYTDPFGQVTTLAYDPLDLYIASSADPLGNVTRVTRFDYRVLAPSEMQDINDNLSEVCFDVLGLPAAMALKGKGNEGDNLDGLRDNDDLLNPTTAKLEAFFDAADLDERQAKDWLANATARHVYYFGNAPTATGKVLPACAAGILREQHASQNVNSPLQAAFEYSDGLGAVVVKKIQAEPAAADGPLRWIASGKMVMNNKGKPVKQYEPYFCRSETGHRYDAEESEHEEGVTPVMYYDAPGRLIRTEAPDGSFSRVEFSPWHVTTYDANDTVLEPGNAWYARYSDASAAAELQRAARLAAAHASTPALTILDSLGREVIGIAHNKYQDQTGASHDEKYLTFTKLDAEGKPLWIRDARGNLVMQYITPAKPTRVADEPDPANPEAIPAGSVPCYDIAGNLLFQHSMDASDRWMLNDAAGKPLIAWNSRGHMLRTEYDPLHRPLNSFVKGADPADPNREIMTERVVYGDAPGNGLSDAQKVRLNLRGKPYQLHDSAGMITNLGRNAASREDDAFDFKGNLLRSTRQLVADYKTTPDWSQNPVLESETFISSTTYDALNRPITATSPDGSVYQPTFNAGNLLEKVDVILRSEAQATPFVTNIDYNAKGQRIKIEYNQATHPIVTEYTYNSETFRLIQLVTTRPLYSEANKRKIQDLSFTYDPVGNITRIADKAQPRTYFDNDCIDASNDYLYDALYRLLAAGGREHRGQDLQPDWDDSPRMGNPIPYNCSELRNYIETYRYDPVGNIMQMIHHVGSNIDAPGLVNWNRRYQYALDSNRLLATSVPSDSANLPDYTDTPGYHAQYSYDVHGNMTRMPHLPLMQWDYRDQLQAISSQVVNTGGVPEITYYVYDAAGQRIRKVTERQAPTGQTPTRRKERIYLGGFEIYREFDQSGAREVLERQTLHIMDDKQRIALVEIRTLDTAGADHAPARLIRFQFGNHLGSATLELDDRTETISYEEYYPYGSTAYQAMNRAIEAPRKRYRYTGKERDEESGLYYHGARYYSPWLGRWGSCDPAGLVDGTNIFIYVSNNPVRFSDPDGKAQFENRPGLSFEQNVAILRREQALESMRAAKGTPQFAQAQAAFAAAVEEESSTHESAETHARISNVAMALPLAPLMATPPGMIIGAASTGVAAGEAITGDAVKSFNPASPDFGKTTQTSALDRVEKLGWAGMELVPGLGKKFLSVRAEVKMARRISKSGGAEGFDAPPEVVAMHKRIQTMSSQEVDLEVERIAKATGLNTHVVRTARKHLFTTVHDDVLGTTQRFDPVIGGADVWGKVALEGSGAASDVYALKRLILHEFGEARQMANGVRFRTSTDPFADQGAHMAAPNAIPDRPLFGSMQKRQIPQGMLGNMGAGPDMSDFPSDMLLPRLPN